MTRLISTALMFVVVLLVHADLHAQDFWVPSNDGLHGPAQGMYDGTQPGQRLYVDRIVQGPGGVLATTLWQQLGFTATSTDEGESWKLDVENPRFGQTALGFLHDGSLIEGNTIGWFGPGRIFRSANPVFIAPPLADSLAGAPMTFARGPSGETYVGTGQIGQGLTGEGGIYRSTDLGTTWDSIWLGSPVREIAVNAAGDIFAVAFWSGRFSGSALYRSTDHGKIWTKLIDSIDATALVIDRNGTIYVAFDTQNWYPNGRDIRVEYEQFILRSTDNGTTWTTARLEARNSAGVGFLAIDSAGAIYAGTYGEGIFRSTDQGSTWTPLSDGLPSLHITGLTVTPSGYIVVGTQESGIYRSRVPQVPMRDNKSTPEFSGIEQSVREN